MKSVLSLLLISLLVISASCESSLPTLNLDDTSANVRALQHLLTHWAYEVPQDGIFDRVTLAAVMKLQDENGLKSTGVVDQTLWEILCVDVNFGQSNQAVAGLQVLLNKFYYAIEEDAVFGEATYDAVMDIQATFDLKTDGLVSNDTWRGLLSNQNSVASTVGEAVYSSCSTTVVKGLSNQLVNTVNGCLHPGVLKDFTGTPNLSMGSAVYPYLQSPANTAFRNAMANPGRTMTMNSAFRSLAQQLLLYQWYLLGKCGISLAAKPGTSNHETGLAIDINDGSSWSSYLSGYDFKWLGSSDPPHFDYKGSGTIDIRPSSTKAFQKLWNKNNPNDKITEDGIYGPNTEARLLKSPTAGFTAYTTGC